MPPLPRDADELMAHADWVRGLAGRLVADEAAAADLVQETWVAALRNPRPSGRALRPWLARVLRNFAWRRHRTEERRLRRETEAARSEQVPPASDAVERLESERELVEVLLALEEPLRGTLVGRYLEGRSAAEIARRDGVPAGTVRWRAKRGLERMRELYDARRGGRREDWVKALVPLATGPGAPPALPDLSTTAAGALAMNAFLKVSIAAVAVLATALGWRVFSSAPAAEVAAPEAAPGSSVAGELAATEAQDATQPDRSAVEAAPPAARVAAASDAAIAAASSVEDGSARVHVRVLDEWGRAIEGARIGFGDPAAPSCHSGGDGRAALHVSEPWPGTSRPETGRSRIQLRVERAGYATRLFGVRVQAGEDTWLGDVVLEPGGRVTGRVLDSERRPVARAVVELADVELPPGELEFIRLQGPFLGRRGLVTVTDERGHFEIEGASVGLARAWARADRTRWSIGEPIEIFTDRPTWTELALEPMSAEERVDGVVLNPDGSPAPEAMVQLEYRSGGSSGDTSFEVRADGTFTIPLPYRGRQWLSASVAGGGFGHAPRTEVAAGELGVELGLLELAEVAVAATDPGGEPLARFWCEVQYEAERGRAAEREPRLEVVDPDGRGILSAPRRPFYVQVGSSGYEPRVLGPFGPEPPALIECELDEVEGFHGVVTGAGRPVAGADISLCLPYGEDRLVIRNGLRTWLMDRTAGATVSDVDGAFRLSVPGAGPYFLRVEHEAFAAAEIGPIDPARSRTDFAIALTQGGAIEGRVRVPRDVDPAGSIVLIHRGVGKPRSMRVGPDGAFRFARLTPGSWEVRLSDKEVDPFSTSTRAETVDEPPPYPWNCEVVEGQTSFYDLDVSELAPTTIRGRLSVPGGLAEAWSATLWPVVSFGSEPETLPSAALNPEGDFELTTARRGRVRLALRSASGIAVGQTIDVGSGDLDWSFGWETGTLYGRLGSVPAGVEIGFYYIVRRDGVTVRVPLRPDEWGSFRAEGLPAGRGPIVRWAPGTEPSDPLSWPVLDDVEIEIGRATRITLE